ncbi:MAG: B12-binding domain-containing protein, partial [Fervidobacterium sp.]
MVDYIRLIREAILNYDEDSVKRLVNEAIEDGMNPLEILDKGLTPA